MTADDLAALRNLGITSANKLYSAGIQTPDQIRKLGAVATYLRVKAVFPDITLNLLWAVEGFLLDTDWRDLSDEQKNTLMECLDSA